MTDAERKDPLKERVQIEIRVRRDAPDNLRVAFIDTMGSGSISSTALDSKNQEYDEVIKDGRVKHRATTSLRANLRQIFAQKSVHSYRPNLAIGAERG